jgi:hypothetical protein
LEKTEAREMTIGKFKIRRKGVALSENPLRHLGRKESWIESKKEEDRIEYKFCERELRMGIARNTI